MIRLGRLAALKRSIRKDDPPELSVPTWDLISGAIRVGRNREALQFLEYARSESERNNNRLAEFVDDAITFTAGIAEDQVEKLLRQRHTPAVAEWLAATPGAEETLQRVTESQRAHHAKFTVKEEPDRYVVTCDPCGTGGRMRRTRTMGTTKKAYPWSWGRSGVPYYCCHCCVKWEILPIESRGYPLVVILCGDRPEKPCVHLFYRKPQSIPEEYFTRLGKTKTAK